MREHYGLSRHAAQVVIFSVQWVVEIILQAWFVVFDGDQACCHRHDESFHGIRACSGELLLLFRILCAVLGFPYSYLFFASTSRFHTVGVYN